MSRNLKKYVAMSMIAGAVVSASVGSGCSKKKGHTGGGAEVSSAAGTQAAGTDGATIDPKSGLSVRGVSVGYGQGVNDGKVTLPTADGKTPGEAARDLATKEGVPSVASVDSHTAQVTQIEQQGPQCFTLNFQHKRMTTHNNDEACSQHKNLLKLRHADVNPKSLCVRVNGTPVRFQTNKKHKDEILIGAIAGPDAKITARYCLGKVSCGEECVIPKDEFMDAIGGSDDGMKAVQIGNWDSDDSDSKNTAKLNADLKRELADLDESEPGTAAGTTIFRDWVGDAETPACGSKQAKVESRS